MLEEDALKNRFGPLTLWRVGFLECLLLFVFFFFKILSQGSRTPLLSNYR